MTPGHPLAQSYINALFSNTDKRDQLVYLILDGASVLRGPLAADVGTFINFGIKFHSNYPVYSGNESFTNCGLYFILGENRTVFQQVMRMIFE